MAHYVTTVRSEMSAEDAFAYMADLENFAEWDPGVSSAVQVAGDGPGLGAAYEVKASGAELRYEVIEFEAPNKLVAEANTTFFRSYAVTKAFHSWCGRLQRPPPRTDRMPQRRRRGCPRLRASLLCLTC